MRGLHVCLPRVHHDDAHPVRENVFLLRRVTPATSAGQMRREGFYERLRTRYGLARKLRQPPSPEPS
jgi:hypothetical protein